MNTAPFGFAIVDKDGEWVEDLRTVTGLECGYYDEIRIFSAPHRIVELYTKEQLKQFPISEELISKLATKNCSQYEFDHFSFARDIEAAHGIHEVNNGIVESSSDEKGE